jgi:hypothetical protein
MDITISRDKVVVGVYNEDTNAIATDDERLRSMVTTGVTLLGEGGMVGSGNDAKVVDGEVTTKHGDKAWFFALLDALWAAGYDVDGRTKAELLRRVTALRASS